MTREEDVHEIDLTELFEIIWNRKLFILLSVTLSAVFSVIYASSQVNYFKSDALLKIVDNLGTSTQSPPGGYASFLGLNMSVDSNLHEELVATIKSKDFFKIILLHGEYILPNISAAIDFDMDERSIIYNENIYDPKKNIWIDNRKPSFLNAYRKYANMLNVGIEKDSGFLDISVEHVSPIFAKELIDIIVIETNILFKNNQLEESSRSLIFLNNKLETESLVNIRDAAQQLIVKNLEKQMMANINEDFVLSFIDNSYVYENKSRPNKPLICFLGTIVGFLASVLYVLITHFIRKNKDLVHNS